ncbi:uncharacterized protein CEXT_98681 [Caerostris extrusa]|uniref:Uncharacterized protein n=1 Tax=Caerostris extrusa TaxID=172846 RepID=A0AAV4Q9K6_CAEEX|nr:uncharacterized protein CEXT_98681 [Caerostris extrusa]
MDHISEEEEFADDLLIFVMDETLTNQRFHRNLKQQKTSSPCTNSIRLFVRRYLEDHEVEFRNIFNFLLGYGNLNENFKEYVSEVTNVFVQRGYKEKEFIEFCAIITKLSTLCYMNNFRDSITLASPVIVEVVKHFKKIGVFTSMSWSKLRSYRC